MSSSTLTRPFRAHFLMILAVLAAPLTLGGCGGGGSDGGTTGTTPGGTAPPITAADSAYALTALNAMRAAEAPGAAPLVRDA